jgi:hypothetical protein
VCRLLLSPGLFLADEASLTDKGKALYHLNSKDPASARYTMELINEHIEAEGVADLQQADYVSIKS